MSYEKLQQENENLREMILGMAERVVNPPCILTDDARARVDTEVAEAHAKYRHIFSGLYWGCKNADGE